jgi:chromatin remodeling complex protein RSC6
MAKSSQKVAHETQPVVHKVEEPQVVVQPEETQTDTFEPHKTEYEQLVVRLEQAQTELKTLKGELQKFYSSMVKDYKKANKGRRHQKHGRSPTGFSKPGVVPARLRTLLNISENEHFTRPDVTNKFYAYVDEHELRDKDDGRILRVNDNVAKAFGLTSEQVKNINSYKKPENGKIEKNQGLNFYNVQRYIASEYKDKLVAVNSLEVNKTSGTDSHVEVEVEDTTVEHAKHSKGRGKKLTA